MPPTTSAPRRLALALLAGLALTLTACGGGDESSSSSGSTQADKRDASGPVTVYSGRDEELIKPLIDQYRRETGNEVEVRYGDSAELASTLIEEGDRSPADVFFSQDAGALGALAREKRLAKLRGPAAEAVPERYRSTDGTWTGTSARARIVAYDTRELKPDELPESILDYTDRRWKGKIGWAPTNASLQSFVTGLRATKGEAAAKRWLEGIVANDPEVYEKNGQVRDAIADGEVQVGFINHYYVAEARAEEGKDYPVGVQNLPDGDPGALVNVAGAGVLASSKRPTGAGEFVDYLVGRKGQEFFAQNTKEYPLAAGVKADRDITPLDQLQPPQVDLNKLADLPGTVELMQETGAL